MGARITLVSLKEPCSACFIMGGLVREMLRNIKTDKNDLKIEFMELDDMKNLRGIEGLEVEKFPAIIINGEQITAGTLPDKKYLEYRVSLEE